MIRLKLYFHWLLYWLKYRSYARKKTNQNKLESKITEEKLQKELKEMVPKTETETDKIEQNVADDIFNNIKDDYDDDDNEPPLYSQISNEIDRDRIEESKEYVKTQIQIRSTDFETIDNVDEENKQELLKSAVDPLDGQYVNDK